MILVSSTIRERLDVPEVGKKEKRHRLGEAGQISRSGARWSFKYSRRQGIERKQRERERDRDARKRVRKSKWFFHFRTKRQLGLLTKESRAGSWASPKTVEICWVLGFSKWRWPSCNTYQVGQVLRRPTPVLVPCHTHNIYCMISVLIRLSSNKETENVYGKKNQVDQSISKRKETTIQDT